MALDTDRIDHMMSRLRGATIRRAARIPPIRHRLDSRRARRTELYAPYLPSLGPAEGLLVSALRADALVACDVSSLLSQEALAQAAQLATGLDDGMRDHSSIRVPPGVFRTEPALFLAGLSDTLLDLAESYLGLETHYLGVELKRELADQRTDDVRQWHLDIEDRNVFKLIVYLSDVDGATDGAFQYLTPDDTAEAVARLGYWTGFVSDSALAGVTTSTARHAMSGSAGSGFLVDTARVLHKAGTPVRRDRYSMTFSYVSVESLQVFPEFMMPRADIVDLTMSLSPRQRRAALGEADPRRRAAR